MVRGEDSGQRGAITMAPLSTDPVSYVNEPGEVKNWAMKHSPTFITIQVYGHTDVPEFEKWMDKEGLRHVSAEEMILMLLLTTPNYAKSGGTYYAMLEKVPYTAHFQGSSAKSTGYYSFRFGHQENGGIWYKSISLGISQIRNIVPSPRIYYKAIVLVSKDVPVLRTPCKNSWYIIKNNAGLHADIWHE